MHPQLPRSLLCTLPPPHIRPAKPPRPAPPYLPNAFAIHPNPPASQSLLGALGGYLVPLTSTAYDVTSASCILRRSASRSGSTGGEEGTGGEGKETKGKERKGKERRGRRGHTLRLAVAAVGRRDLVHDGGDVLAAAPPGGLLCLWRGRQRVGGGDVRRGEGSGGETDCIPDRWLSCT